MMELDRRLFVAGALAAAGCASLPRAASARPPLWGDLGFGPHAVGFRLAWLRDPARPGWGGAAGGRPIQAWRWYPAAAGTGRAMRVADYARLFADSPSAPTGWPADPQAALGTGYDPPLPVGGYEKLAPLPVAGRHEARPARGALPLVVIGQGFSYESPFHQHLLAEYLASHGYTVITAPLTGVAGRQPDISPATFDAQIRDMAFLMHRERARRVALVGFDLGGMAAFALAAERPVSAVIGLDTGVIAERLIASLLETRPGFDFARQRAPYLHVTRAAAENQARNLPEDLRVFEQSGGAPRALLRVPGMRHIDFTVTGSIERIFPGFWDPIEVDPSARYYALLRLIRAALDHWTGPRATAPWQPAVPPPLTLQQWR